MATKAEKKAALEAKAAEKAELRQLEQAQKVEIKELKAAGASKDEIKAEKADNKVETRTAKTTLSPAGRQTLLSEGQPVYALTSSVGTYGNAAYADTVQNNINNVVNTYEQLGLMGMSSVTGTMASGLSFSKVHNAVGTYDPETGRYTGTGPITKTLNTAQDVYGKTLTQDQLDALGYTVKPVKGQEGLFQIKHKDDTVTGLTFLKQNEDGTYTGLASTGATALNVPTGFFTTDIGKLVATLGPVALSIAFPGLGNAVGTALGATGTAATVVGNAAIAGLTTGVITGDVEKGLIAGALSAAGTGLVESGALGDVFDSLGLGDYKSTFNIPGGVTTGEAVTGGVTPGGAFDMGGAAGTDLVTGVTTGGLPSVGTGAFDVGGAEGTGLLTGGGVTPTVPGVAPGGAFDMGGAAGTNLVDLTNVGTGAFDIGGAAGTGLLTGATAGAAAGGAAGTGLGGLLGGTVGNIVSNLASGALTQGGLFNNLVNAGIDFATADKIASDLDKQAASIRSQATAAGAAAQVPFTPYTLTTGAGTTTIGPTGATVTAAAPYQQLQQTALQQAQAALGAINPAQAAQDLFTRAEALAAPSREREQEALLGRLGARGLLGISRNLPTVGGEVAGVNPFLESLLSSQRTAQAQTALQAQQFGTQEAMRQQQLAAGLQGQGLGIDQAQLAQLQAATGLTQQQQALAQANAQRQLQASLAGLGYSVPLMTQAGGVRAGQTAAIGTQAQNLAGSLFGNIFSNLGTQGQNVSAYDALYGGTVENPWYG